ncbi:MAG: cupin domain-containing protein, partial [Thermoleophilia bacterium]|nr:cupin domain-containing protein [Thermoleophilia bacterium]
RGFVLTVDLNTVELQENPMPGGSIRVEFPLSSALGTAASAAVLFELEPGNALATHTDSSEELLLVLGGEGEAHVGGETGRLREGQLAVVPPLAPHGIRNVGDTTLRVLGFFAGSTVVSVFDDRLGPEGERVFVTGAPTPVMAHAGEPSTLAA